MAATISLNEPLPVSLGDSVSFTTTGIPSNVQNPRIEVLAYQDDALVYGEGGAIDHVFQLGGAWSLWLDAGGPADVVANLYHFPKVKGKQTYVVLATTSFPAEG